MQTCLLHSTKCFVCKQESLTASWFNWWWHEAGSFIFLIMTGSWFWSDLYRFSSVVLPCYIKVKIPSGAHFYWKKSPEGELHYHSLMIFRHPLMSPTPISPKDRYAIWGGSGVREYCPSWQVEWGITLSCHCCVLRLDPIYEWTILLPFITVHLGKFALPGFFLVSSSTTVHCHVSQQAIK